MDSNRWSTTIKLGKNKNTTKFNVTYKSSPKINYFNGKFKIYIDSVEDISSKMYEKKIIFLPIEDFTILWRVGNQYWITCFIFDIFY